MNISRTDGYVANIDYVHGFYRELGPAALNMALLLQGVEPLNLDANFSYCELGCGFGLSTNLFAACHLAGNFYGIDFNQSHIKDARDLAERAGLSNVTFLDTAFADLDKSALPVFDFIVLHGVYSWVNSGNRRHILDFISSRLKPDGVLYISYNTLPGWASFMPVRELMLSCADTQEGPINEKIKKSVEFIADLKKAGVPYFARNPCSNELFEHFSKCSPEYLAHELYNRDWNLFCHDKLVKELAIAALDFVGSANPVDNLDPLIFSQEEMKLLDKCPDSALRETVKDFITGRQFRKDIFTRGRRRLSANDHFDLFCRIRFTTVLPKQARSLTMMFPKGEAKLDPALYQPVLLAIDDSPRSVLELLQHEKTKSIGQDRLIESLIVLLAGGLIMPATSPSREAIVGTMLLNYALLERTIQSGLDLPFLASPVLQNGIKLDWVTRTLLLCKIIDVTDPLTFAYDMMVMRNYPLEKDGVVLRSKDEQLLELNRRINVFSTDEGPWLSNIGITTS